MSITDHVDLTEAVELMASALVGERYAEISMNDKRELKQSILETILPGVANIAAQGVRAAAKTIYNGAGDPQQALYNEGGSPYLDEFARKLEGGEI